MFHNCRSTATKRPQTSLLQPQPPAASSLQTTPHMDFDKELPANDVSEPAAAAADCCMQGGQLTAADAEIGSTPADAAIPDLPLVDIEKQRPNNASGKGFQARMCVLPEKSEALPGPASGWQAAVAGAAGKEVPGEDSMDVEADRTWDKVDVQDDMGDNDAALSTNPAEDGNTMQFFFMDALYEPAMVGTVVMIGKVRQDSEYVSACVCVKGMRQCLYVVPKPFVFQDPDGDIARCAMCDDTRPLLLVQTCKLNRLFSSGPIL